MYNKKSSIIAKIGGVFVISFKSGKLITLLDKYGFCICFSKSRKVRIHGHDFLEFTYIQKGSVEHTINGHTEILSEGDYFIVDYGTKHQYHSVDNCQISVINFLFYPNFIDRTLGQWDNFEKVVNSYLVRFKYRSLNSSPTGVVFHDSDKQVCNIVKSVIDEYNKTDAGHLEYIRCLLVQILIITMRKITKSTEETRESGIIKEITDFIKDNYNQNLTLSDFAHRYSYSLSHLSKKFKVEMNVGFVQYLHHIRIERGCRLLQEGYRVSEVADMVGYSDIKFFNKVFKQTLGVTPREFKKMSK